MSAQKRGRACESCQKIKIKCSLGQHLDDASPPCERCLRLNKECIIQPSKTQKDRVAELEAQVAALTRLLRAQGIDDPSSSGTQSPNLEQDDSASASTTVTSASAKKRRLEADHHRHRAIDSVPTVNTNIAEIALLDEILPYDEQSQVLERYMTQILPQFPMVPPVSPSSLDDLRKTRATLLCAVLYGASLGIVSLDKQEDIACLLLDQLMTKAASQGVKSLDLIQAIQLACLFYRTPKPHRHMAIAVYQLIELATKLASEISMSKTDPWSIPSMDAFTSQDVDAIDVVRAWLGCHMLSSCMSTLFRRPSQASWSENADNALMMLEYSPVNEATDRWLSQYFRAEHLLEEIAAQMEFVDLAIVHDLSEPEMRKQTQTCRNKILSWRMTLPVSLRTPKLSYWEHVAIAYMHEPLLHTATNKQSFAAPYVAERLSLIDFPTPIVTQDHTTALFELVAALHAMIDIYSSFDTQTLLALPGLLYTSRAAYAHYVLSKLYIAMTAPGNTLGAIIDSGVLMLSQYGEKLAEAGHRVRSVDDRCSPARILQISQRLRDWYANYTEALTSEVGLLCPVASQNLGTTGACVARMGFCRPKCDRFRSTVPAPWQQHEFRFKYALCRASILKLL